MSSAVLHSFVVPTYGRSPHLEDCLGSLSAQCLRSEIVVVTSTPFPGIDSMCAEFGARLEVHGPNRGIGPDWNAALAAATTRLVTVAHQDDIYLPAFAREVVAIHARYPDASISFCDAGEIEENGQIRRSSTNVRVKRVLVGLAYAGRQTVAGAFSRRVLLGLGNPIVCPAVTINLEVSAGFRFRENLRTNMDWLAWLDLSERGPIAYIPRRLMDHRVHTSSETSRCLDDGSRRAEDAMVFRRLWPAPVADLIGRLYSRSYQGYL